MRLLAATTTFPRLPPSTSRLDQLLQPSKPRTRGRALRHQARQHDVITIQARLLGAVCNFLALLLLEELIYYVLKVNSGSTTIKILVGSDLISAEAAVFITVPHVFRA